jgi:hypothetical protein
MRDQAVIVKERESRTFATDVNFHLGTPIENALDVFPEIRFG